MASKKKTEQNKTKLKESGEVQSYKQKVKFKGSEWDFLVQKQHKEARESKGKLHQSRGWLKNSLFQKNVGFYTCPNFDSHCIALL